MLSRLGDRLAAFFRATAPDPFVIAVLLTLVTAGLALVRTDATPASLVDAWTGQDQGQLGFGKDGVWRLLAFAMQMCLILVTGHALASTRPVLWTINKLAALPRTGPQAVVVVAFAAALLGLINWGLALVGGAIIARRVGLAMRARGIAVHYPLVAAAGYMGLLVFHGGFSGTAPLKVTTEKDIAELFGSGGAGGGLPIAPIPIDDTLLSPMNFIITGGLVLLAPLVLALLHPRAGGGNGAAAMIRTPDRYVREGGERAGEGAGALPAGGFDGERPGAFVRLMEDTPIINGVLAAIIGVWAWGYYFPGGGKASGAMSLTPDSVNLTMLMLGLILHGTPRRYIAAVEEAASGCGAIIIQFPLYAGIMGMMQASGLTKLIAEDISGASTPGTLPLMTFLAATVVGLFIPSGGAQWAVQGPIALQTAADLGVEPSKMVMAIAYGDQLANMPQPFWALPLLAITGVKARDIIAYTVIVMGVGMLWVGAWLLVL